MSRRLTLLIGALVLAGTGVGVWGLVDRDAPASGMPTRTIAAGPVTVSITPLVIDATTARFQIALDTHSGSLDIDLAIASELLVDGQLAPPGVWDGAAPGGHHREGTLTFSASAVSGATVRLRIGGLPTDVSASWQMP